MSSITVVDINEQAKQEVIEEAKQEVPPEINEEAKEVKEEAVNEVIEQPKNEVVEEECKEIKKPEKIQDAKPCVKTQDKLITCSKCNKSMKLKSYRYKHEKACQGTLEQKAVKPFSKPRAKPKAQPKIENTIQKQEVVELPTHQTTQPQLTPYEIARQSYIQMKEELKARKIEKINNFKSKMF